MNLRPLPPPPRDGRYRRQPYYMLAIGSACIVALLAVTTLLSRQIARPSPTSATMIGLAVAGMASLAGLGASIVYTRTQRARPAAVGPVPRDGLAGERRGCWTRSVPRSDAVAIGIATPMSFICGAAASAGGWVTAAAPPVTFSLLVLVLLLRMKWQGGIEVRWRDKTIVAGTTIQIQVGRPSDASSLAEPEFHLRCVATGSASPRSLRSDAVVAWQQTVRPVAASLGPDEFIVIEFDVPTTCQPSRVDSNGTVYWELIVRGRTLWGTFSESFVLPMEAAPHPVDSMSRPVATA